MIWTVRDRQQRIPALALLALVAGAASITFLGRTVAQELNSGSALAGIEWPVSAYDWSDQADGPRQGLIEQGATDLGMHCGATREFHVWNLAAEEEPEQFRAAIERSYAEAGWELTEPVVVEPAVYLAMRGDERLVVWLNFIPEENALALFSCIPQVEAVSMADISAAQSEAAEKTDVFPYLAAVAAAFLALGGLMVLLELRQRHRARLAQAWAEVPAVILKSTVNKSEHMGSEPGEREVFYTPEVRYSYVVEGAEYQADRIRFGSEMSANEKDAAAVAARYPAGSTVAARVNPARPAEATLLVDPPRRSQFIAPAVIFAVVGVGILVIGRFFTV